MNVTISPGRLSGQVSAPPSKSMAHRYLIAAALADGESHIAGISSSEDISATVDCLRALGAEISLSGNTATVRGFDPQKASPTSALNARESGSTLRFLIPLAWLSGRAITFLGSERLLARPLSIYSEIAERLGLGFSREERSLTVRGRITGGHYPVRGDISSQFITGLLFALPLTSEGGSLLLLPPVESRSYLDLTLSALRRFGVTVKEEGNLFTVPPVGRLSPCDVAVEGDYSNAAFFDALALLGHEVEVSGLDAASRQGDRVYREYFAALDAGMPTLSLADCPDLGPILMAVAAAKGGARFTNTRRRAVKESDRGAAMAEELGKLGCKVLLGEDEITVPPALLHAPSVPLSGHNDHRIVMALSTLLSRLGGTIEGAEAVNKSLPEYFELLKTLGCKVEYK